MYQARQSQCFVRPRFTTTPGSVAPPQTHGAARNLPHPRPARCWTGQRPVPGPCGRVACS
jgi:hypothetical protein